MEKPILSIYIPTYNHEKYIAQALDSVLMQKTKYTYEVIIGDDASTDNTPLILKEYEKKYPQLQIIYRKENMYNQKIRNSIDLEMRCRGKYMIALEGDDYWIDENKIERQINFLEQHPDYVAVSHNCVVVDKNSENNGEQYPECKDEEYTVKHLFSEILPGQLTTVMRRNYYANDFMDVSLLQKGLMPGDRAIFFALAINGKIHCIQEKMSAYRHVVDEGTSYSARNNNNKYSFQRTERMYREFIEYTEKINNKKIKHICEFYYHKNIHLARKLGQITKAEAKKYKSNVKINVAMIYWLIKYFVKQKILKTSIWI